LTLTAKRLLHVSRNLTFNNFYFPPPPSKCIYAFTVIITLHSNKQLVFVMGK